MRQSQLSIIVDNVREFGTLLDDFCVELRDRAQSDSTRLILQNIARWKRRTEASIERLKALETAGPDEHLRAAGDDVAFFSERVFADSFLPCGVRKQELTDVLWNMLDALLAHYDWLLERRLGEATRAFVCRLREQHLEEMRRLEKIREIGSL